MPAFFMFLSVFILFTCSAQAQELTTPKHSTSMLSPLEDSLSFQVNVFPNPSPTRRFSVIIHSHQVTTTQIQIQDAFQRVVFQKKITPRYGVSLYSLNLSNRPKGWYYLVVISSNRKVIKRLECL